MQDKICVWMRPSWTFWSHSRSMQGLSDLINTLSWAILYPIISRAWLSVELINRFLSWSLTPSMVIVCCHSICVSRIRKLRLDGTLDIGPSLRLNIAIVDQIFFCQLMLIF